LRVYADVLKVPGELRWIIEWIDIDLVLRLLRSALSSSVCRKGLMLRRLKSLLKLMCLRLTVSMAVPVVLTTHMELMMGR
jgi:hypothetical protein